MKTIDTAQIRKANTEGDYVKAEICQYFLYDKDGGPALWHRCFCDYAPRDRDMPQTCELVWRGHCIKRLSSALPSK
ncbi:hypothetical protein LCGC14_0346390 [marine sediment metagenome]|uniref:Uncharacterized protein n=1 Tax=marine sediment metagenome TaxID=412755 RepID=A0A0F9TV89_9ZZZZ